MQQTRCNVTSNKMVQLKKRKVLQGIYTIRKRRISFIFDGEQTKQTGGFSSKCSALRIFFAA